MNLSNISYTGFEKVTNECICGAIPKRAGIFIILLAILLSLKGVFREILISKNKSAKSEDAEIDVEFAVFVYTMVGILGLIMTGAVILLGTY